MTRRNRPRGLTGEEIALWRAVAATVDRRSGAALPETPLLDPAAPSHRPAAATAAAVPTPAVDKASRARTVLPLTDLDRRTRGRIARGRIEIERVIDLHGLTQADAHGALRRFLHGAQAEDRRLVLVVTGKGERSRTGASPFAETGVLKRLVPHWLRESDLRAVVLGFEPASVAHGGAGALYVRLRRRCPSA